MWPRAGTSRGLDRGTVGTRTEKQRATSCQQTAIHGYLPVDYLPRQVALPRSLSYIFFFLSLLHLFVSSGIVNFHNYCSYWVDILWSSLFFSQSPHSQRIVQGLFGLNRVSKLCALQLHYLTNFSLSRRNNCITSQGKPNRISRIIVTLLTYLLSLSRTPRWLQIILVIQSSHILVTKITLEAEKHLTRPRKSVFLDWVIFRGPYFEFTAIGFILYHGTRKKEIQQLLKSKSQARKQKIQNGFIHSRLWPKHLTANWSRRGYYPLHTRTFSQKRQGRTRYRRGQFSGFIKAPQNGFFLFQDLAVRALV